LAMDAFPCGELRSAATGARLKRQGLKPGWPDYLFISPGGDCISSNSNAGTAALRCARSLPCLVPSAHGVRWCCARSYDEAIAAVTAWGVLRREVRPQ
jgi:hypothetical protein